MKTLDIPKSGKCGQTVWQRNRFCQYSYPAFTPFNPRTPNQLAIRAIFAAVSTRWRTLPQEQRDVWCAVARTMKSRPRLRQCGPLTGFLLFVKVNVALAHRGLPQVDLPPGYAPAAQPTVPSPFDLTSFNQPSVGPTLFLQANHLIGGCDGVPRTFTARGPT